MKFPLITNIQRFSLHDGEGIRTTVFFKGCPLRCKWCHNPESQVFRKELLFYRERCVGCRECETLCPACAVIYKNAVTSTDREKCRCCGLCAEKCRGNAREIAGKEYTVDKLMKCVTRDVPFYEESGGGVTLSGGEVMAQDTEFLMELVERLQEEGISVNIDTCGDIPWERFERIYSMADTFLYDIKCVNDQLHRAFTGQGNGRILENLKRLYQAGAKIHIRVPVVKGFNGKSEEMEAVAAFTVRYAPGSPVSLIPYHGIGISKWERLEAEPGSIFKRPDAEEMEGYAAIFKKQGIDRVKIGG